jgi:predicted metal-dependent hydrolase
MTALVVRRLLIDLDRPFDRRWNGCDAFRTAFFNALSMSFPAGEQFFIDSVRTAVKRLPAATATAFESEIKGFIGQEATHRRIHALFNGELARQGHVNRWEGRIVERTKMMAGADPRHAVAITAATEHITAVLAEYLLSHPQALYGSEARLRTMWLWHSAEESEHRSTAFDAYRALQGDETWRRRWMRSITLFFITDLSRQTLRNLRHDGALLRPSTWRSAAGFLFSRDGLVRRTFKPWRAYFSPTFHPSRQGSDLGAQWLRDNSTQYVAVN